MVSAVGYIPSSRHCASAVACCHAAASTSLQSGSGVSSVEVDELLWQCPATNLIRPRNARKVSVRCAEASFSTEMPIRNGAWPSMSSDAKPSPSPPDPANRSRINNRTHRKLLIMDGRVGFTGGVGIGDQWRGDARNPAEWRELHYRATGPVVAAMQGAFASNWVEDIGEILQGPRFFPELAPEGGTAAQLVLSATGSRNYMHMMLMTAIGGAQSHIRIATPCMVPDDVALAQLLQARERGVEVDIIVPGEHMDKDMVRNASRHFWGPRLEAGVRIHEYQTTFMHAKLIVIDEAFVSIGSTDFDGRSFRLNDEANLNVFDQDFAREQIGHFLRDLELSRPVTLEDWQNRPLRTRLADWAWSWLRALL